MISRVPKPNARCPLCGNALSGGSSCDTPTCRTRAQVQKAADIAKARDARRANAAKLAESRLVPTLAAARQRFAGDDPVAVTLPPFLSRASALTTAERRAAFLAHLDTILTQAFAPDAPALSAADIDTSTALVPAEPVELDTACIACRGWCCVQGAAHHAFLTCESLLFQRHLHPRASAEDLRTFYIDHMPQHSTWGSCVFHGARGCTLPRDRRADICNAWQCTARAALAAQTRDQGTDRVVALALCGEHSDQPQAGAPVLRVVTHDPQTGFRQHDDLTVAALPENPES